VGADPTPFDGLVISVPVKVVVGPPFTEMVACPFSLKFTRKGPIGVKAEVPGAGRACASALVLTATKRPPMSAVESRKVDIRIFLLPVGCLARFGLPPCYHIRPGGFVASEAIIVPKTSVIDFHGLFWLP
jgi:hypothetical protein